MVCSCGALIPIGSPSSMCVACLTNIEAHDDDNFDDHDPCDMIGDHESALASAGWGTDESYDHFGDDTEGGYLDYHEPMDYELD